MCVCGGVPAPHPALKASFGCGEGPNSPLLPGQMGSGGCGPGDPHCNPPLLLSTLSQGTKPWVGGWKPPSDPFVHRKHWRQPHNEGWG